MSKWFTSNKLVLNLEKTNTVKFITKKSLQYDLKIGYDEKYIEELINTKFLGLQIDNHVNLKNHIDLMIPKLSRAYYAIRSTSHMSSTDTLKSIYFAYFHSIMKFGIFFGVIPPTVK
jgi:predicted metallopeptidase